MPVSATASPATPRTSAAIAANQRWLPRRARLGGWPPYDGAACRHGLPPYSVATCKW